MKKKLAITSHRNLSEQDQQIITKQMQKLASLQEVEEIYFGGARGGDTVALQAVLDIPHRVKLIVVVPNTLDCQPIETISVSKLADQIIELNKPITSDDGWNSYINRDQYLVDISDQLIGFFNGIAKGGTYRTIKYARSINRPVTLYKVG